MKLSAWFTGIGRHDRTPRPVASRLVQNAASGDVDARKRLIELGPEGLPVLRELLEHDDSDVRRWTVATLTDLGQQLDAAAQVLSLAFEDVDADVREDALQGFLAAARRKGGRSWTGRTDGSPG